ncbi:MAG TPA: hypothetical protein VJ247_08035, partial [Gaiella sp.]|nr:hypothetical protein [Gaiella sp.]
VPSRFEVSSIDDYLGLIADTAGPVAFVLRGLSDSARAEVRADVEDALRRFAAGDGYELPAVALCAVAS